MAPFNELVIRVVYKIIILSEIPKVLHLYFCLKNNYSELMDCRCSVYFSTLPSGLTEDISSTIKRRRVEEIYSSCTRTPCLTKCPAAVFTLVEVTQLGEEWEGGVKGQRVLHVSWRGVRGFKGPTISAPRAWRDASTLGRWTLRDARRSAARGASGDMLACYAKQVDCLPSSPKITRPLHGKFAGPSREGQT